MAKKKEYVADYVTGNQVIATPEEVEAVQVFSIQLVEDYGYPRSNIATHPQHRVKARPSDNSGKYPVDIAVFQDERQNPDDLYIIVECKKKTRKDGRSQLEDYMRLSRAYLGVWFNGDERLFIRKFESKGSVTFEEIPNIPLFGQRLEDIGKFKKRDLKSTHNLKAIFKSIRNHLAANNIGATRDEMLAQQLINLIFCKIYDEKFTAPDDIVRFRAGINESDQIVVERVKSLFRDVKSNQHEVFTEEDSLLLDDKSIVYVVGELQNYSLMKSERDVVADAFETFIGKALKGGQGQFFTPRNVVKMIVDILDPDENDRIIDPACGSGGFLIEALKHVWLKSEIRYKSLGWSKLDIEKQKSKIASQSFRGIDKDYFLSKVAKAYMNIIGDGTSGIFCEDSLEDPKTWSQEAQNKIQDETFDIVIANPPFGSKIPVTGKNKLERFAFGYKWTYNKQLKEWVQTKKLKEKEEPQVLFIEKCLKLLKPGGKMALVLPSGILGNQKERYLRQYIQDQGHLFAIVELPFETFSPNVTIHTSVLFITKGVDYGDTSKVFISINENCGHDKKGRPVNADDISNAAAFYFGLPETDKQFFISPSDLEDNFVAKRYLKKYVTNELKIKSSKFEVKKLASVIKVLHNGANIDDASIYVDKEDGIPYILVKSITKEGINFENLKYIRKDLISNKDVAKNIVTATSIVMTRAGNSGISANIPSDLENGIASGFLIHIKIDPKKINPYYLVSYLNSPLGQLQLERISSGSILQSIRGSDLKDILVIVPPKEIQLAIGDKMKKAVDYAVQSRLNADEAQDDISNLL